MTSMPAMLTTLIVSCGTLVAGLAGVRVSAAEPADPARLPTITVADVSLGLRAAGEPLTVESLQHRVVVFAFWNHESQDSRAMLPLLEQLHRSQAPAGLLVVGAHIQSGGPVEVREAARKADLTFPVVVKPSIKGLDPPAPPHVVVFDHTGAAIASGTIQEVAQPVLAAVRAAPPIVLAGRHLQKLPAIERMLRDDAQLKAALHKATELAESADEATAEEARFVLERLGVLAASLLAKAEATKATDPAAATELLHRVATAFRGHEAGDRAVNLQREWKRDPQVTNGLQAAHLAWQLEALRAQALAPASVPRSGGQPGPRVASMKTVASIPPAVKDRLAQLAASILLLGPGSTYASRAEEIAIELGLDLPTSP